MDHSDILSNPSEELDVEYKDWLDLSGNRHKAKLAKAMLALHNHGGGRIVLGFREVAHVPAPNPQDSPESPREKYSQDIVNGVVDGYCDPSFHVSVEFQRDHAGDEYPVVVVPGAQRVPAMSRRGGPDGRELQAKRVYIRRAGPKSEEPQSSFEWQQLVDRLCDGRVRPMPDEGSPDPSTEPPTPPSVRERLSDQPPPPSIHQLQAAREALDPADEFVLANPISERRIDELRTGIEAEMARSGLDRLFSAAGSRIRTQTYEPELRFGTKRFWPRGILVEGSQWVGMPTYVHTFARAFTDFLLRKWIEVLEAREVTHDAVIDGPDAAVAFVESVANDLRGEGGTPDLVLLTGVQPFRVGLMQRMDYGKLLQIRGNDVSGAVWSRGLIAQIPVHDLKAIEGDPRISLVDLTDFELRRTPPAPDSIHEVSVVMDEISEERAAHLLTLRPALAGSLARFRPDEPAPATLAEQIVTLQLLVELETIAAGSVWERNEPRTRSARVILPSEDSDEPT